MQVARSMKVSCDPVKGYSLPLEIYATDLKGRRACDRSYEGRLRQ